MADRKGPKLKGLSRALREDTSTITMPLFAYFIRVGLSLLALLLVLNFMLEPKKPEPDPSVVTFETVVRARATTGSAHPSGAASSDFEPRRSEATNYRLPEQGQQVTPHDAEPIPVTGVQPKGKSERTKVSKVKRQVEPSAYSSIARGTSYLSAAENRHAPW
jgi:hypothetical protein